MKRHANKLIVLIPLILIGVWWMSGKSDGYAALPNEVDFNLHVKPILSDRCFKCHGPDENARDGKFRLDIEEVAFAALDSIGDRFAIVPGEPENSQLIQRIRHSDPEEKMPPPESNLSLSAYEIKLLEKWISQGAEWKQHWSFIPPEKAVLPKVPDQNWPKNAIDHFVLARLDREGLKPAVPEDKAKLIRRLSFDLRGLPPSPGEIDAFLADESDDAYEQVVDRMLASEAYGERMAVDWLDLARYGDTQGYHHDFERNMWPWRDWVIRAFNQNMSYDQFATWQLAGDLLPNPSYEQQLATAFNRNHKITQECGVIDEEFRVEYVVDRTNTLGTAFLGLTLGCAQCHDHKYDPISQEAYYQFFAFFNQVPEKGKWQGFQGSAPPYLEIPEEERAEIKMYIDRLIAAEYEACSEQDSAEAYRWVWEEELSQLLQPVMVMTDMDTARPTFVLNRGVYSAQGKEVRPTTPTTILPYPDELPPNRLGLASWLFQPGHPLTARVAVNRYWQMIFGQGIVSTPEDFGNQGALPSHPQLLDWLAVSFQESGWDLKQLMKQMVMSATYQQAARTPEHLKKRDPDNVLLARGPQARLSAEMVRDNALAISGLLSHQVGGPGVKPYQPKGLWIEVSSGGRYQRKYMNSHGKDLYRRSMYTFWKRIQPPPAMMIFDASSRNNCIIKRQSTSTPLQAMVLLNDPQFTEAARVLADRMIREGGNTAKDRIAYGFRWATSRFPDADELEVLEDLLDMEIAEFKANPEKAAAYLKIGESPQNPDLPSIELAAYAVVASTLLNLIESIHKS